MVQELKIQQIEQNLIERLLELKQLSTAIDKTKTVVINAKLTLELAILQSQRGEDNGVK